MYLRTTLRKNKDGSSVRYLQLAHNSWDPVAKRSKTTVIYNFGREDASTRGAVERLVASASRFLDPDAALAACAGETLSFIESRPIGGAHVLDALWRRLEIDSTMRKLLLGRRRDSTAERVLFALVANRALDPTSKLAAARWISEDAAIEGLAQATDDACYRTMDWLLEIAPALEREVFHQVASLLDLEVDLLFFDTTSTYFETDGPDEPVARDERGVPVEVQGGGERTAGFRTYGKSKDSRDDLPQIVIGMAVTRGGIPVRVWSWPGNTADSTLIRQVKDDLRDWTLSRVIWVADRGFTSAENRRYLRRGDHHYIIGEKLRSGSPEASAALSRQGRYREVAENLRVKEVRISEHERFVVCHNPEAAERDAAVRERMVAQLEQMIERSDRLSATKRAELRGVISAKPGLARYLRATPGGLLRINARVIEAEGNLDGKYLLRSSDPALSAEDMALGYKQQQRVEEAWRTLKSGLRMRPVFHWAPHRIHAHIAITVLSLLLERSIEHACQDTWRNVRDDLKRIQLALLSSPNGRVWQVTEPSTDAANRLKALNIKPPKPILNLD